MNQIKIEDNGLLNTTDNYIAAYFKEDSCPIWSPLENQNDFSITTGEPILNSTKYAYQYEIEYTSYKNGSDWFFYIEPLIECSSDSYTCTELLYSVLVTQDFICIPECEYGSCSKKLPNTCDCSLVGRTGDRCELRK